MRGLSMKKIRKIRKSAPFALFSASLLLSSALLAQDMPPEVFDPTSSAGQLPIAAPLPDANADPSLPPPVFGMPSQTMDAGVATMGIPSQPDQQQMTMHMGQPGQPGQPMPFTMPGQPGQMPQFNQPGQMVGQPSMMPQPFNPQDFSPAGQPPQGLPTMAPSTPIPAVPQVASGMPATPSAPPSSASSIEDLLAARDSKKAAQDSGKFETASGLANPSSTSAQSSLPKGSASVTSSSKASSSKSGDIETLFPSEEMIGKMTDELYLKMADLERESALISLQIKRDQLQNDLYKTQADQRQKVADEIAAREKAARDRLEWELTLEEKKAAVEEKRRISSLKMQQIEEALTAMEKKKAEAELLGEEVEEETTVLKDVPSTDVKIGDWTYRLVEIRGSGGVMFARIKANFEKEKQEKRSENFFVRKGTVLPNGYEVTTITQNSVYLKSKAGEESVISIAVPSFSMRGN